MIGFHNACGPRLAEPDRRHGEPAGRLGGEVAELLRLQRVVPDAQVLAGVVKNTVLVAHTEQTPREVVAEAKKRIEASGGALVGLVLNLRSYPIPRFLYRRV